MASAGPKGRDGPSPREFTAVRHFMMADLGLSGLPLLVYARIFGFCDAGCGYFESKGGLARFLNVQERSVHRAIHDLLDRGLIEECGVHAPARRLARSLSQLVPHISRVMKVWVSTLSTFFARRTSNLYSVGVSESSCPSIVAYPAA